MNDLQATVDAAIELFPALTKLHIHVQIDVICFDVSTRESGTSSPNFFTDLTKVKGGDVEITSELLLETEIFSMSEALVGDDRVAKIMEESDDNYIV